jgi:hypothetical protein
LFTGRTLVAEKQKGQLPKIRDLEYSTIKTKIFNEKKKNDTKMTKLKRYVYS